MNNILSFSTLIKLLICVDKTSDVQLWSRCLTNYITFSQNYGKKSFQRFKVLNQRLNIFIILKLNFKTLTH